MWFSNFLRSLRSILAMFILTKILGWNIERSIRKSPDGIVGYDTYKTGKYVAIYLHTSLYDHLIGVLFSYALNLQFITIGAYRSKKDMQNTGISYLLYSLFDTIVVDPHKDRKTTCESIIRDLNARENFIFSIYPEGSIHRTAGLKSAFYKIARKTNANVIVFDLDYHTHKVGLRPIINNNVVVTSPSKRILEIATEEMVRSVPFDATRTYLMNVVHLMNQECEPLLNKDGASDFDIFAKSDEVMDPNSSIIIKGKQTSLIDMNRSWMRFFPLMTVMTIVVSLAWKIF